MKTTFDFKEYYELENDSCKLIPLEIHHYQYLLNFALREPELWQYSLQQAGSSENMKRYIEDALESRKNGKSYAFIVYDKIKESYAGCTRLYDVDLNNCNTSLGYTWYGKEFQGTGLNKNCKYVLMEFIFDKMKFERLEFRLDSNNKRSLNALKSLGCVIEGVLRSNGYTVEGGRRSSIVMSVLKEEWENGGKNQLGNKLIGQTN